MYCMYCKFIKTRCKTEKKNLIKYNNDVIYRMLILFWLQVEYYHKKKKKINVKVSLFPEIAATIPAE